MTNIFMTLHNQQLTGQTCSACADGKCRKGIMEPRWTTCAKWRMSPIEMVSQINKTYLKLNGGYT